MAVPTPYNIQSINEYWTTSRIMTRTDDSSNLHNNDQNNNSNPVTEPSLLLLSSNCLDCNYKTKRQRVIEAKLKETLKIASVPSTPKVMPVVGNLEILSSILTMADFNLTAQLGKGSFGTVFAAEFIESKRKGPLKVAIKLIQTSSNQNHKEQLYKSFVSELNAKGLKHPNIVLQLGYNKCDLITNNAFIIYELCGTINLKQFLIDSERVLSVSKRKSMSLDLIKAMEYIHAINIIHMDIKPANIIVTNNLVCKLTDFGCSIKLNKPALFANKNVTPAIDLDEYADNRWTAGTWYYRAPELFRNDKHFFTTRTQATSKCDIYSLGIVMWQLLSRESPYNEYHENPQVVIYQIISKNLRPQFPPLPNLGKVSPLTSSKSSSRLSSMTFTTCESLENRVSQDVLAYSRSVSSNNGFGVKKLPDNSEFERVFRNLIEISWSDEPGRRYDATSLKEILLNTKISY